MSQENTFLADVEQEGANPFKDIGEETQSESLTEEKSEEVIADTSKEEEAVPFHKHPRWIERENELEMLRQRDAELEQQLAELTAARETQVDSQVPDWFSELYGDNLVAWQKYSAAEQARTAEIEQRILARQQEEQMKAQQEAEFYDKWINNEIAKLEDEGLKFDRNELLATMIEYSPTDSQNNLDFRKGFNIYSALQAKPNSEKSDARKQIADSTSVNNGGELPKKDYVTSVEARRMSWGSL
jgi:hypothetical protein